MTEPTYYRWRKQRGGMRRDQLERLIVTAKMNEIDPQAWLADVLARMPNLPVSHLQELLPRNRRQIWSEEMAA